MSFRRSEATRNLKTQKHPMHSSTTQTEIRPALLKRNWCYKTQRFLASLEMTRRKLEMTTKAHTPRTESATDAEPTSQKRNPTLDLLPQTPT